MKRGALIAVSVLLCAAAGAAEDPRRTLNEGVRAFREQRHDDAAKHFADAAVQAPAERLDPAIAHYNEGLAHLATTNAQAAAEAFDRAARTSNLMLQQQAWYNRGNALMELSRQRHAAQQLEEAIPPLDEAQAMYERAMTLDPADEDPKVNHELAGRARENLKQLLEQQQQQQQQNQQGKDQKNENNEQDQSGQQGSEQKQDPSGEQEEKQDQPKDGDEKEDTGREQKQDQQPESSEQQPESNAQQAKQPTGEGKEMTPEEAAVLLDGARMSEEAAREQLARERLKAAGRLPPVEKDW